MQNNNSEAVSVHRNNAEGVSVHRNNAETVSVHRNNAETVSVHRNNAEGVSVHRNNAEAVSVLRDELHQKMHNVHNPSKSFIEEWAIRSTITDERVQDIFNCQCPGCEWITDGTARDLVLRRYVKILAILIWIGWKEWSTFQEFFLGSRWAGYLGRRSDDELPFAWDKEDREEGPEMFSPQHTVTQRFYDAQWIFVPIIIKENMYQQFDSKEHRLPFIESRGDNALGIGAFGVVTKEIVASGQFHSARYNRITEVRLFPMNFRAHVN